MNIIRELSCVDRRNEYVILLKAPVSFDFPLPPNFSVKILRSGSKVLFDYFFLPLFSWFNRCDVYLFPKNTFSPLVRGKKIPVYHDIIYYEKLGFREFNFFDHLHHTVMIRVGKRFSAADLTVSDFTASRMKELLSIDSGRIVVIKEGVEDSFKPCTDEAVRSAVVSKFAIKQPFFFYSGSLSPRKNMLNLLRAFQLVADAVPHNIYFTGGDSWRDNEVFRFIEENGLQKRVIRLGYLSDAELTAMYSLADCYLYPSIYEGFGLPILEAQACGCPVITSIVSSCPEVAGNSALLVDPRDPASIAAAMKRIVSEPALKDDLRKKGFVNCARFSWKRAAEEMVALFEKVNKKR